jgi:hypothetical protein
MTVILVLLMLELIIVCSGMELYDVRIGLRFCSFCYDLEELGLYVAL